MGQMQHQKKLAKRSPCPKGVRKRWPDINLGKLIKRFLSVGEKGGDPEVFAEVIHEGPGSIRTKSKCLFRNVAKLRGNQATL